VENQEAVLMDGDDVIVDGTKGKEEE